MENRIEQSHDPLFKRNLGILIFGRFSSALGSGVFSFAMALYILDLTNSASTFSLILICTTLPITVLNLFGGFFVDRISKKKLMVGADLLSSLLVFVFFLLFRENSDSVPLIISYVISLVIVQSCLGLSMTAAIPEIFAEDKVAKVNSTLQGNDAILRILCPVIGATLYSAIGMEMIFILEAICFLISGMSEIFLRFPVSRKPKIKKDENAKAQVKELVNYLKGESSLRFFLGFTFFLNIIFMPIIMLGFPFIFYKVIGMSAHQLSFVEGALAIGVLLGALNVARLKSTNNQMKKFFMLLLLQGVLIFGWIFPIFPVAEWIGGWGVTIIFMALMMTLSLLNTSQNIPIMTYFQLYVPRHLTGRLIGILSSSINLAIMIGIGLYGSFINQESWAWVIATTGCLMILLSLFGQNSKAFKKFKASLTEQPIKEVA